MIKQKLNLTIILFLMITTGFIIYFMYLKPEPFDCITNPTDPACKTTTTTKPASTNPASTNPASTIPNNICNSYSSSFVPASIVSRYFGVGFNIYPVKGSNSSSNQAQMYLIEHIPITIDGIAGGVYSLSSDGLLTIKIKNDSDSSQWWSITDLKDIEDSSNYQIVKPYSNDTMALQYSNGSLSLRPYMMPGFESQRWITSLNIITRGIPVINVSPASMFTTEFDPYSTSNSISTNLADSNNQQVNAVINAVKNGIQQYLLQVNPNNQVTSSSLGNKKTPLSINLNLGGSSSGAGAGSGSTDVAASGSGSTDGAASGGSGSGTNPTQGISFFDNVTGSISQNDMLSILDKYDSKSNNNNSSTIYTTNSLENQLNQTSNGCKLFNINDYTSNRVSTCNCKL